MPYCSQCGVEVHNETQYCPLCEAPIQKLEKQDHPERNYPDQAAKSSKLPPLSMKEKLRVARGISIIVFLIPILFTTTIDYFIGRQLSWSPYVIVSLVGVLGITLIALFFPKRGSLINLMTHLILIAISLFLNILTGFEVGWSIRLALVIFTGSWIIIQLILKVASLKKGNLLAASIITGTGILCLIVDIGVNHFLFGSFIPGWSLIVLSALVPTTVLLLYLYSTPFRKSKLRRFMHL